MAVVEKRLQTRKGEVVLARGVDERHIRGLGVGQGLGVFFHYRQENGSAVRRMLSEACQSDGGRLACAVFQNCIIAYAAVVRPEAGTRWHEINGELVREFPVLVDPVLLELGSIEVSTPWRSIGLARTLLRFMFEDPIFEEKIVLSRELSWHWDLRETGLSSFAYRSMLLRLFESAGFRYFQTDDEEIGYAGENMLTVRTGERVPPEAALRFYLSLSRREPRGWGWG
jgi:acetoin utilization protein AcuA